MNSQVKIAISGCTIRLQNMDVSEQAVEVLYKNQEPFYPHVGRIFWGSGPFAFQKKQFIVRHSKSPNCYF